MGTRTIVIIKPDAIERKLASEIVKRFGANGFKIIAIKTEQLTRKKCQMIYAHLRRKNRQLFDRTLRFMLSTPVIVMALEGEGEDAAAKAKQLGGATDPSAAGRGTIRGDLGIDSKEVADKEGRPVYNLIHIPDPEDAEKELKLFFA